MARSVRALAGAAVAGGAVALAFAWVLLAALHAPAPHHLSVAVVAPTDVTERISTTAGSRAPGAMDLRPYADPAAAERDVRTGDLAGAFVVGPSGPQLLVAGARGAATRTALEAAFTPLAAASGQPLAVRDLVPLPDRDRAGISTFFAVVGMLVPSFVVGVLLGRGARRLPLPGLLRALVVSAALVGGAVTWAADGLVGALPGHPWQLAALVAAGSFAVTGATLALARAIGLAGLPLAGLALVVFGIPSTGGPAGRDFLPRFFGWVAGWHPTGAVSRGIREVAYFGSHGLGTPILVLAAWAVAGLVLLLATAPLTLRATPPAEPVTHRDLASVRTG